MGRSLRPSAVAAPPVRLVVPFTPGSLCRGTEEVAAASGLVVTWAQLPTSHEHGYGRLFRRLWAEGETFVILEHDVIPTAAQLSEIACCGHGWCSFRYDIDLYPPGPSFGLARFDRSVMEAWPLAAEIALVVGKRRDEEVEWWRVDSMVARDLTIRRVGWHEHLPPVHHAHRGPPSGPP